ncbi:MAG: MBL fold metallo-hydrolase [Gemmatimonadetes bacterium]|nr:MBL fold metallo-hydrolase [Gemmatimonadota bacterium]
MSAGAVGPRAFLAQAGGCLAHVLLSASCASPRARGQWTAPSNPTVTTQPFARLDAIGAEAWAVISTPLGGDRTTFANGGIIAGTAGVVVVEGFYRSAGAEWLARQARALTGRWPTHVVLTHYHVDHASGVNGYAGLDTAPGAPARPALYATASTRTAAVSGAPVAPARDAALERAFADVVVVGADRGGVIDLGNRTVRLEPLRGHTASDLVVHDEDARLTFAGDLVWSGMFPNFVDADPRRLAESVAHLARSVRRSARQVLVPGHGGVVTADGMAQYEGLLASLEAAARGGYAAGRPAAEVAAGYTVPSALGEWMATKSGVERAMTAWYRVLAS